MPPRALRPRLAAGRKARLSNAQPLDTRRRTERSASAASQRQDRVRSEMPGIRRRSGNHGSRSSMIARIRPAMAGRPAVLLAAGRCRRSAPHPAQATGSMPIRQIHDRPTRSARSSPRRSARGRSARRTFVRRAFVRRAFFRSVRSSPIRHPRMGRDRRPHTSRASRLRAGRRASQSHPAIHQRRHRDAGHLSTGRRLAPGRGPGRCIRPEASQVSSATRPDRRPSAR